MLVISNSLLIPASMSDLQVKPDATFWGETDDAAALQGFRTLVETTDDGIYRLDADGRFAAVNDAFADLTGYAREELLEEHVSILLEFTFAGTDCQ